MAAVNLDAEGPGRGRKSQVNGMGVTKLITGTFDFDASYPTGGEDISTIFNEHGNVKGIVFESKNGYVFDVSYTNKTVRARHFDYVAAAAGAAVEVPNGTNLSAVTGVRWMAWG